MNCPICQEPQSKEVIQTRDFLYETTNQPVTILECTQCGHIFQQPFFSVDDLDKFYPENYEPTADSDRGAFYGSIRDRIEINELRSMLNSDAPPSEILDAGSGNGKIPRLITQIYPQAKVTCLDINQRALEQQKSFGHDTILGNIETVSLPKNHFDLVFCLHLLEHTFDPRKVLLKLYDGLKPNGKLLIEVPNHDHISRKLFGAYWAGYDPPRHLHFFLQEGLKDLCAEVGFKVVTSKTYVGPLIWTLSLDAFIKSKGFSLSHPLIQLPLVAIGTILECLLTNKFRFKVLLQKPS